MVILDTSFKENISTFYFIHVYDLLMHIRGDSNTRAYTNIHVHTHIRMHACNSVCV